MKISIYEAKTHFSKIIQDLVDGKEEIIIISKRGEPVVQMTLVAKKNSKRVGVAKKDMEGFDISLEEFNSISTLDFGL
jgi:antitoxin (DNA-binding transcriptional repressor) of toxin-antitoxin stability system